MNKLLALLQILIKQTDENHKLTTNQLIEKLAEQGISAHRNTIPEDIKKLRTAGYDIICDKSTQNKYFMGSRGMELSEIKMLCDAVNAAQFISEEKSFQLIDKLFSPLSDYQKEEIRNLIQQPNENKADNKSIYYADAINTAITQCRKIRFQYYEYNEKREKVLKHNGYTYTVSPYAAVWNDDRYYLVGYCEKHKDITVFRIDRLANISIMESIAIPCPKDFVLKDFIAQTFKMFSGEPATVTLKCKNKHMKAIIDKFGDDIETNRADKQFFTVKLNVELSPTFYAWLFQYQGEICIQSPQNAIDQFVQMGETIIEVHS